MAKKARIWDGSQWVDIASAVTDLTQYANLTTTPISGFRNAIINGGFDIWQRGTSATAVSNSYTPADRWVNTFDGSSSTTTISRQSFTPGNTISGYEPEYFLRYAQTSAGSGGSFRTISQRIENVRTFAGQTVTISFWAKADSSRTVDTRIRQNFGSGGSANVDTSGSSINLTTSWSRYSTTVTLPSISGKTVGTSSFLDVFLFLPLNTTQTIDIWGVQLEPGTIATPFEQRPIGTELALCQRYYWRWVTNGNTFAYYSMCMMRSGTVFTLGTGPKHPVTMRAVPSVFFNSMFGEVPAGGGKSLTNGLVQNNLSTVENVGFVVNADSNWGAAEPGLIRANGTNAAYVEHSAEL
jgi:hypothetical protein